MLPFIDISSDARRIRLAASEQGCRRRTQLRTRWAEHAKKMWQERKIYSFNATQGGIRRVVLANLIFVLKLRVCRTISLKVGPIGGLMGPEV